MVARRTFLTTSAPLPAAGSAGPAPMRHKHSDFLINEIARYRVTDLLAVATNGFRQDNLKPQDVTVDEDPDPEQRLRPVRREV